MLDYQITDGDLVISGGDIQTVSGRMATRQRLEQKLLLWRGEWFLDTDAGFPWLQSVVGQRPTPQVVRSLVFDLVQSDPSVRSVENLVLNQDNVERRLEISFDARLTSGETETIEVAI